MGIFNRNSDKDKHINSNLTLTLYTITRIINQMCIRNQTLTLFSIRNLIKQTYVWNQMLVLLDDKCDKTNTEVKIRPEKNSGLYGIWTHDLCDTNWELVIMLVPNEPVKWWINDCKYMKIVSFFQAYFQYRQSISRGHYCEDRFRIHFFIRSSHTRFSYFHRQNYNYHKGKWLIIIHKRWNLIIIHQ